MNRVLEDAVTALSSGDYATALKILRPLAAQGQPDAQYNLGVMYREGHGVPQDYGEALKWLRLAAVQGHVEAQTNLGVMYAMGLGVPQDYTEAVKWFRLAAEQGDPGAQHNLGVMYRDGTGVPQDYVRAHMWFSLSAAHSTGDEQKLAAKNRNNVASRMTPAQIAEAQRLAQQCQAQQFKGC